jgi:hypothetical protein
MNPTTLLFELDDRAVSELAAIASVADDELFWFALDAATTDAESSSDPVASCVRRSRDRCTRRLRRERATRSLVARFKPWTPTEASPA